MQILGPSLRLMSQNPWGQSPAICVLMNLNWLWCSLKSDRLCFTAELLKMWSIYLQYQMNWGLVKFQNLWPHSKFTKSESQNSGLQAFQMMFMLAKVWEANLKHSWGSSSSLFLAQEQRGWRPSNTVLLHLSPFLSFQMHTGAARILDVMVQTLLGLAASLVYPDRSFLHTKEYFSQEADHIPKDSMAAKESLPAQSTKKEKNKKYLWDRH